ncbi:glycoside hydrolase family 108 protein [Stappia taiwanensis]|uniref:Glycoside hydrolase family 108 protein n=1 Tax=Stappia taiwanensis TaxID=992267 RepID=A0A838Y4H1_9HYPH|nr:glycoside hydrolase family 108 protein [Stappia taiwanensis]MBA4613853.1 glycoside hydrolase family 108 protein [Stappia taiwanensis]GGE79009.1 hypothetical protein GCM10007285_03550 [Stappia taiwanensis]
MAIGNFSACLTWVLAHEGGYSDHPNDPGGATNKGVTQQVYTAWRRRQKLPTRSVRQIEDDEVRSIYRRQYWDAVQGDSLPAGLDYAVFDYAVNSGPGRGIRHLQEVLRVRVDGHLGEKTLEAARSARIIDAIKALCERRMVFLRGLRTWSTFGRGWTARVMGRTAGAQDDDIGVIDRATLLATMRPTAVPAPKPAREPSGKALDEDTSAIAIAKKAAKEPSLWGLITGLAGTVATIATSSGPVAWAIAGLLVAGGVYAVYRLERARAVAA